MSIKKIIDIKVLTFDCYGTLIDWDSGIKSFFREILFQGNPAKYRAKNIDEIIKRWETIQFQLIKENISPIKNYRIKALLGYFVSTMSQLNLM